MWKMVGSKSILRLNISFYENIKNKKQIIYYTKAGLSKGKII
jgi:hypothetical protein